MSKFAEGWQGLLGLCLESRDEKTLASLLDLILTPEEKANLATRYLIIKELLQDEKPQREIAKDLNVSIAKITRGSNELKRVDKKLLNFLKNKFANIRE